jgi:hypothetical protein
LLVISGGKTLSERNSVKVTILSIILLGVVVLIASAFLLSSFFAIIGFSLVFWGTLLLYIIPTKTNSAMLVNAAAEVASANIERLLQTSSGQKGIYLPISSAKSKYNIFQNSNQKSSEKVEVFIPNSSKISIHNISDHQLTINDGIFITPHGMSLYRVFEHQMGKPLSKINLNQLTSIMPSILTKGSKFAESVDMQLGESTTFFCGKPCCRELKVKVVKSIFEPTCQDSDKQPQLNLQIGCILASALACALALVIHKPVTIANEDYDKEKKITQITFVFKE